MNVLQTSMIIISSATLLGYTGSRYLRLQPTIAILSVSLIFTLILNLLTPVFGLQSIVYDMISTTNSTDFRGILLDMMLPILLFSGAMSMNAKYFRKHKVTILSLAIISTLTSTLIVGYAFFSLTQYLSVNIDFIHCLLFGALISPTDPVAVVGLVKQSHIAPDIEAKIAGESLFNDGVGIVIFGTLYSIAFQPLVETPSALSILYHFSYDALGGCAIGLVTGYLCQQLLSSESSNSHHAIFISLFIVTGVYTFANTIGMSGALAMVVCGLWVGQYVNNNKSHYLSMLAFWETLEEILNMILYLLIGLEAFLLPMTLLSSIIALSSIALVLFSRVLTISIPMYLLSHMQTFEPKTKRILIWGGLRGGLAVALTLSIPESDAQNIILIATYAVVCFTTIVQGGTISRLLRS